MKETIPIHIPNFSGRGGIEQRWEDLVEAGHTSVV
jgi:hypothetical protein